MITIISGVPGSGKTGLVVDMIMDELKTGRKVYTSGIPDLLLNVHKAGNIQEWEQGTWLQIDHYNPKLTKQKDMETKWMPRDCPSSCEFLSTCGSLRTKRNPDSGALLIIDEAHIDFPQRASGKAPPPYVEALNVHRHQGLDVWFLTQRPSFLDPFVRGLCSRHIHLAMNAFSFTGSRVKYQWAEYQETVNRTSKLASAKESYKPMPHVFPLYASATTHTKLDQAMPNVLKFFIAVVVILIVVVGIAVQRVNSRIETIKDPTIFSSKDALPNAAGGGGERSAPTLTAASSVPPAVITAVLHPYPVVDSCVSGVDKCKCYTAGRRVAMDIETCNAIVKGGWTTPQSQQTNFTPLPNPSLKPLSGDS